MDFFRIRPHRSLMQNSLWHHDAYPDLPDLLPNSRLEIGRFEGPGIIKTIHLTVNIDSDKREDLLRGVFIEAHYDSCAHPSIHAPLGDFFCDSFGGRSIPFASVAMAKRPTNSYFCYIPMPFQHGAVISLVNTTDKLVTGYGYVTAEQIPAWGPDMGYFHARWLDLDATLPQTLVPLLDTRGKGHFFGCHLTAVSACPHFHANGGICEGNDEFYVDDAAEPTCNYLGTEDFFGFSWNWRSLWQDDYSGTTYLNDDDAITKLGCYRFLLNDPVRFERSLLAQINYRNEIHNVPLRDAERNQNGQVKFGIVTYWYQDSPVDATRV